MNTKHLQKSFSIMSRNKHPSTQCLHSLKTLSRDEKKAISSFFKNKNSKKYNFLLTNQENVSQQYYEKILIPDLLLKQNYSTLMQIPCLKKIILNTTSKNYRDDKKFILFTLAALELISGQKPQYTLVRQSIANFKIRQDQIIGCQVVLRHKQLYTFLDKLLKIIFPRVLQKNEIFSQDFSQTQKSTLMERKKRPLNNTYNFGFQNVMIFPELETNFELVENFQGLTVTFVFSHSTPFNPALFLSGFQVPTFI